MTGEIMNFQFTDKDFSMIADVLGAELESKANYAKLVLKNPESGRQIILEIYEEVEYLGRKSNLLVVHTGTSHMQMHNCAGFIPSEMLGEVAFISENGGSISGVIVEKGASISIYTNVDRKILTADFSQMRPEIMMAGLSLGLAEHILPE
jgi:hypothetical protein